ncbi:MAG TPA: ATP-binding cassette domain-containing protein [Thermoanaerobaculia bacterium]|nr:ATP-binding cassette domain-containing protein [Thermoanaerobaculia bacterium]
MPSSITVREVFNAILQGISLHIDPGEAVAFVGRSGAGKTTTLRLINGLVKPARGEVLIDDVPLARTDLVALRRRTGYIIQGSGLFPHRTVYDNVATVPRLLGWSEDRIRAAASEVMTRIAMPLEKFGARYPRSLSGGEQQRVGIARAIVANPSILLCDEPFGALDPIVRRELQETFRALRSDATIVFVTHDLAEAMRVADRVVLFEDGAIVSDSTSLEFPRLQIPLVQQFVAAASLPA